MIRILHMIGSLNIGGSQAMVMSLYRKIDRKQVQFDFIIDHPEETYFADEVRKLGGKIYSMPSFSGANLMAIKKSWKIFFEGHPKYKVLHSHVRSYASVYIPIARRYGVKTIIHSHSTSNGAGLPALVKFIMQYPLRYQADYLFACSEKAGKWLFGRNVLKKDNFRVISNAIDVERFKFDKEKRFEIRKILGIEDDFVIGHVGRFTEPKNHRFLIDVFAEICKERNDVKLLLVGDGELRNDIENKIKNLNIDNRVLIMGNLNNTEDYYQAMDLFIFPSLWEGLGIVAVEAQASGLQCIVSERIPKEIDIKAGLVKIVSLDESKNTWVHEIRNLKLHNRVNRAQEVKDSGYDVTDNAIGLQKFYLRLADKVENS